MAVIFDQFYTNPKVSDGLVIELTGIIDFDNFKFIEPSAGSGNFIDSLKKFGAKNIKGYDIDPKIKGIKKADFTKVPIKGDDRNIFIGNPPFGKRAKLALEFVNKSLEHGSMCAMILPKQFNRYLTQKNLVDSAVLVESFDVEDDAFIVSNKKYDVKTVFQIWVNKNSRFVNKLNSEKTDTYSLTFSDTNTVIFKDKRLKENLPIIHKDFESWIHNNTIATRKYFNKEEYNWDVAVHRQGFYEYNKLFSEPDELVFNRQYLFIKFNNRFAKKYIKKIDFEKLSKSNTQTPGFSKTDFVQEYINLRGK